MRADLLGQGLFLEELDDARDFALANALHHRVKHLLKRNRLPASHAASALVVEGQERGRAVAGCVCVTASGHHSTQYAAHTRRRSMWEHLALQLIAAGRVTVLVILVLQLLRHFLHLHQTQPPHAVTP